MKKILSIHQTIIYLFLVGFCLNLTLKTNAQSSLILEGCAPLETTFSSDTTLTSYFWDFGNGNTSNLQNPDFVYTEPGDYVVSLFDGPEGNLIGSLFIEVYPDIEIMFEASSNSGCSPFQVDFNNLTVADEGINILSYQWDFGDGSGSTEENPTHLYTDEGTYNVSLKINSEEAKCTQTKIFESFITVSGRIDAAFIVDKLSACEAPASFIITNLTEDDGFLYEWDFDNGDTSNDKDPGSITYNSAGTYDINLKVDNQKGCVINLTRTITVGTDPIDLIVPDTFCLETPLVFLNQSPGLTHSWSFGNNAIPTTSTEAEPSVRFNATGIQTITFRKTDENGCVSDTFFTLFIEDPTADFTIDPLVSCDLFPEYTFTAQTTKYPTYIWNGDQTNDPVYTITQNRTKRDSFDILYEDIDTMILFIRTSYGCTATLEKYFTHQGSRAHASPSRTKGCAPLTVNFDDRSRSIQPIIQRNWDFGDGTMMSVVEEEDMIHTYEEPGSYYVRMNIQTQGGCSDTAAGFWIEVGEPLTSEISIDQSEICLGESVSFTALNNDPRIDAYHFNSDDGRLDHCYTLPSTTHTFIHEPGKFPVSLTLDYNGCLNTFHLGDSITVNGSKSRIKYMTSCETPYEVMFQDSSLNADFSYWLIQEDSLTVQNQDPWTYTFDERGIKDVVFITTSNDGCPNDTATAEVHITEITASFDIPDFICASESYLLDASASQDVDDRCHKGYTWYNISDRPRTLGVPQAIAGWGRGEHIVRLETTDINGCKATAQDTFQAYEAFPDFDTSMDRICFPTQIAFTDLTEGDTTIVAWDWSFGSVQQNPVQLFTGPRGSASLPVTLITTDAIGCADTISQSLPIYEPTSNISLEPGAVVCIGDTISLTASDYTEGGHFLNYFWNFEPYGTSTDQSTTLVITDPGTLNISLIITEDSTGCNDQLNQTVRAVDIPNADFSFDGEDTEICFPDNILFDNESFIDGPGNYTWNFGNGTPSTNQVDPISSFDKGSFDITLIAASRFGCSDTIVKTAMLVGPEGDFFLSTDSICPGESITFTMTDTVDVTSFSWIFYDGTVTNNENPVTYTYDLPIDSVLLLLRNDEQGCDTEIIKNFVIKEPLGEIEQMDFDTLILEGTNIDLSSIFGFPVTNINTNNGALFDYLNCINCEPVIFTAPEGVVSEVFEFSLISKDSLECASDSILQMYTISVIGRIQVPNIFSPNNDGVNDYFDIVVDEQIRDQIDVVKLKVYNRWGNLIYDNDLPEEGWDGRVNGEEAPAEVYTYVLEVVYLNDYREALRGNVTLIK